MFYLEGFFRSAEIEYWACVAFLHGALLLANTTNGTSASISISVADVGYMRTMYAACLINIAVCRAHQPSYASSTSISTGRSRQASTPPLLPVVDTTSIDTAIDLATDDLCDLLDSLVDVSAAMDMAVLQLCDYSLAIRNDKVAVLRKYFILEKLKM
jgi:hypothetical protein